MTNKTVKPSIKQTNANKFNEGEIVECVKSTSCGYKEGGRYEVYKNSDGNLAIMGEDGFEDLLSLVLSSFKVV